MCCILTQFIYIYIYIYIYIVYIIYVIMQNKVDHVLFRLNQCGLNVRKSKCATLNIIINPQKK